MAIPTLTSIGGTDRSGKSFVGRMFNSRSTYYVIDESDSRSTKELEQCFNEWKASKVDYNVVLVGSMIYKFIDFDFGNIPKFYISCDAKHPFVLPVEGEQKPLF